MTSSHFLSTPTTSVETWLSTLKHSENQPANVQSNSEKLAHFWELENSYTRSILPVPKNPKVGRARSLSVHSDLESNSSSVVNSEYRSTWELLSCLPSRRIAAQMRTMLPTHHFTIRELTTKFPGRIDVPLVSKILFSSLSQRRLMPYSGAISVPIQILSCY